MPSSTPKKSSPGKARSILVKAGLAVGFLISAGFAVWIFGIIRFNGPFPGTGNSILATAWLAALAAVPFFLRNSRQKRFFTAAMFLSAVVPYLFIRPGNDRIWDVPYTQTAYAEVEGDGVTIHHFRSFDYGAGSEPIPNWSTRTYDLRNLRGMDFFMSYWGSEYIGHPIFSFDFGAQGHLAFTIEARMEKGETYSLFAGLYKRYELSYIPCEESDAVRARTNFRENENVHLYRTVATPAQARARFLEFIETMNKVRRKPRFYNVITSNCTTAVRSQMTGGFPFDWRIIVNGKLDEMLYDRGLLVTGGLPFEELKRRAFINPKVRQHPEKENFSTRIRENVTGF